MNNTARAALALGLLVSGCNDTRDLAPPSPDTPWQISSGATAVPQPTKPESAGPKLYKLPADPALPWADAVVPIDFNHVYGLDELIDIAERNNKQTRVAWEQARQAAIKVGIAQAKFLPNLSIDAFGGYNHGALPFPKAFAPKGYIISDSEAIYPALSLKYLLFDFGGRAAAVNEARQLSFAANVAFTAAHQEIILAVARAYFNFDGANAQLLAARQAGADADLLAAAAQSTYVHGMGNIVDVDLARQQLAQAEYQVAAVEAQQHEANYILLEALGLPPMTKLRVADSSLRPLPRGSGATVDALMNQALRQRPDVLAQLAELRATDADIARARAETMPRLSISADLKQNIGQISTDGAPYLPIDKPEAGVFIHFDWPIYAGGALRNEIRLAQSRRDEADAKLQLTNEQAMREVALAYDQLDTGLSRYGSAQALLAASRTAFNAALDAYRHGIGSLTDASKAESTLAQAQAAVALAHAQVLASAAGLAFAAGDLTSTTGNALIPP